MLIAYHTVFQTEKKNEHDTQPELFVGQAGNFMLVLRTNDFEVRHKNGKAEVSLARYLTNEELRAFALTLLDSANAAIKNEREWLSSELLVSADADCPACDGSGKVG